MLFKASIERVRMRVLNFLVYWILPTAVVHQLSNIRPDLWRHIGQHLIFLQSCKSSVTFLFLEQLATGVHFFIEIFLSVLGDLRVNFKAVLGAWSRFWSPAIIQNFPVNLRACSRVWPYVAFNPVPEEQNIGKHSRISLIHAATISPTCDTKQIPTAASFTCQRSTTVRFTCALTLCKCPCAAHVWCHDVYVILAIILLAQCVI